MIQRWQGHSSIVRMLMTAHMIPTKLALKQAFVLQTHAGLAEGNGFVVAGTAGRV